MKHRLVAQFYGGTRKLPQDFWPPLIECLIKFVLQSKRFMRAPNFETLIRNFEVES